MPHGIIEIKPNSKGSFPFCYTSMWDSLVLREQKVSSKANELKIFCLIRQVVCNGTSDRWEQIEGIRSFAL